MKTRLIVPVIMALLLLPGVIRTEQPALSEQITEALKKEDWKTADTLLQTYLKEQPDKKWAYSSHAWALQNLKQYNRAIEVAMAGLRRWPDDASLKKAVASALAEHAMSLPDEKAIEALEQSLTYRRADYVLYRLAKKRRDTSNFTKAVELLEAGKKEFPEYPHFSETLPYTWLLYFKSLRAELTPQQKIDFARSTVSRMDPSLPGFKQSHYLRAIELCMRDAKDQTAFESIYRDLQKRIPDDATIQDEYGFLLYAIFRNAGQKNDALREEAIRRRRIAYSTIWKKHARPEPIRLRHHPLRGRFVVWSEFGGSAMTHNGLAHYCYDFAGADASGRHHGADGRRLTDHFIFGAQVFAVGDGTVTGIVNGKPDNPIGGYDSEANTVTVSHGNYSSFYVHLKSDSIKVKEGATVKAGQLLGLVGNSGMSTEPHLHFCLYGEYDEGQTIPFLLATATVQRQDGTTIRTNEPLKEDEIIVMD